MAKKHIDHTFVNAVTVPTTGTAMPINEEIDKVIIKIEGTSTSRTVSFWRRLFGGNLIPIAGYNAATKKLEISTTGNDEIWEFETNDDEIVAKVDNVSGGYVTIRGRGVKYYAS